MIPCNACRSVSFLILAVSVLCSPHGSSSQTTGSALMGTLVLSSIFFIASGSGSFNSMSNCLSSAAPISAEVLWAWAGTEWNINNVKAKRIVSKANV